MTDPQLDQYNAASRDMLGILGKMHLPISGEGQDPPPNWMMKIIARTSEVGTRCEHLKQTPIQPVFVTTGELYFRCEHCFSTVTPEKLLNLDPIEEHTCDRCRTFSPGQELTPFVARISFITLTGGVCDDCLGEAQDEGGTLHGGPVS